LLRLVHDADKPKSEKTIFRALTAMRSLTRLNQAEIKHYYDYIETIRDALSRLLDKADGKDA
jgi:hypothetical protein